LKERIVREVGYIAWLVRGFRPKRHATGSSAVALLLSPWVLFRCHAGDD